MIVVMSLVACTGGAGETFISDTSGRFDGSRSDQSYPADADSDISTVDNESDLEGSETGDGGFSDELDFVLPDGVDLDVIQGQPGAPCLSGDDCDSGFCIQTPVGKQCTMLCTFEDCPFDWVCVQHQPSLPDEVYMCAPLRMNLCKPCDKNSECLTNGAETGDMCVPYGNLGNFCGSACMGTGDCPEGYQCEQVLDVWGFESNQCVLSEGECACQPWFVDEGAATTCLNTNDLGVCEGHRVCTAEGLTACDAKPPAAELCNAKDDDCDGLVDEEAGGDPCYVENENGSCLGAYICFDGELTCDAPVPAPEACDGKDNNCNGTIDEGFPDSDLDGMADCLENDKDGDGVVDIEDNCQFVPNPEQDDFDLDDKGDVCDKDDDNDLVKDELDCKPLDPDVNPNATEICNSKDDDCDGLIDEGFPDSDSDALSDCVDDDDDNDGFADGVDCGPVNKLVFPGAIEVCDGLDNDCDFDIDESFPDTDNDSLADCIDPDIDDDDVINELDNCPEKANQNQDDSDADGTGDACDPDADGDGIPDGVDNCLGLSNPGQKDLDLDGIGDPCDEDVDGDDVLEEDNCPLVFNPTQVDLDNDATGDACDDDLDGDQDPDETDCAPNNPYISSLAIEECDGLDNDCDGAIDQGFPDFDADGLKNCVDVDDDDDGDPDLTDCGPLDSGIHGKASEICNNKDDNCDGKVDNDLGELVCGKGICFHSVPICVEGDVQNCDPFEGAQTEVCNNQDDNWNGQIDEDLGWISCGKGICFHMAPICSAGVEEPCDPTEGAQVEACNGQDDDCDGKIDEELGTSTCGIGQCEHLQANCIGGVEVDCDPLSGALPEVCDGLDNNCDDQVDEGFMDTDNDTFADCIDKDDDADGEADLMDCAPLNPEINHTAIEVCDGLDNNCDGQADEMGAAGCEPYFFDADGDGHGTLEGKCLCNAVGLWKATVDDDCSDLNPWIFPGATELCDGVDNNCDGVADEDGATGCSWFFTDEDKDGYGSGDPTCVCDAPGQGWSVLGGDCDEEESQNHPGAFEVCDEMDNDCDGEVDENFDFDTDEQNCGSCDYLCQPPNAYGACADGKCGIAECVEGYENCNISSDDGCETHTGLDPDNCGECGNVCELDNATASCLLGICTVAQCDEDFFDKDEDSENGCEVFTYGQEANPADNCKAIINANANAQTGWFWVEPLGDGTKFQVYCDMTTDGGGWTLVWSNRKGTGDKATTSMPWNTAINTTTLHNGSKTADPHDFDYYVGLKYWNELGSLARYDWANDNGAIDQRFYASISLTAGNYYALQLSSYVQKIGSTVAGIWHYHKGLRFSTYDADHDSGGSNCSSEYSATPFWYHSCWSGSINGGGQNSGSGYYNGAYWDGSQKKWGDNNGQGAGNGWFYLR